MSKSPATWPCRDYGGMDFDTLLFRQIEESVPFPYWSEEHLAQVQCSDDIVGDRQTCGGCASNKTIFESPLMGTEWERWTLQSSLDIQGVNTIDASDIFPALHNEVDLEGGESPSPTDTASVDQDTSSRSEGEPRESGNNKCLDCSAVFDKVFELEAHAKRRRHKPFECGQCFKRFSRRDACRRHISLHSTSQGKHECRRCGKYQGRRAFKRRDHLVKHLRTVHHIGDFPRWCPHINCGLNNRNDQPEQFRQEKDYDRHMHECHGGKANTCSVPRCEKWGGLDMMMKDRQRAAGSPVSDATSPYSS